MISAALLERFPFLENLQEEWQPIARWAVGAWLAFYLLFILQAARGSGALLMIDLVFLPIHEGGHLIFRWFGDWLHIAGGTLLQLFVPLALAVYFYFRRQLAGTAFCAFFLFEQFLPIATYMADSRSQVLSYVTVGDPEFAVHDWFWMLSRLGVLEHDTQIAAWVRMAGWLGMLATISWFAWRGWRARVPAKRPNFI